MYASDYEIIGISPVFVKATPGFGKFTIEVEIASKANKENELIITCLYTGLTRPGVYYKNEPQITKQYKIAKIGSMDKIVVLFDNNFRSYHPETLGEIIVSIVGSGVVRSKPLKTSFHPRSQD